MKFRLFNFNSTKKADYYKLSFYDGFANKQNAEILGSLIFERFYSLRRLNKSVSKIVGPFGRYLLAFLIVTKFDSQGEIIAQLNYFDLFPQTNEQFGATWVDNDINYLSELLYSQPA